MSTAKPVDHIKKFISDMRADHEFGALADDMERLLYALDIDADSNPHTAACVAAMEWIIAQPRSVREKLDVICKLTSQKGQVNIPSIKTFAGW